LNALSHLKNLGFPARLLSSNCRSECLPIATFG